MTQIVSNVTAAKPAVGGAISTAPTGTSVPTDAVTKLAAGFKGLGYISEDGMTNENTRESEEIKAWGGDVVATPQTSKTDKFKYKLIEVLSVDVLKEVFGQSNVTGDLTTGIKVQVNSKELDERVTVIDMILANGVLKRIVIPKGKIVEMSEIPYKDSEVSGYEVTVQAFPDSNGNTHYEYMKSAATSTSGGA